MTKRPRVLVVEDSVTSRMSVLAAIEDEFDCVAVQDGQEALDLIQRERVDAVLTDLHMPRMGGVHLLRTLRESAKTNNLPVLVMTTETGLDEVNECRRLGCAGYVLKPVEKTYLLAKLRKLFGVSSSNA